MSVGTMKQGFFDRKVVMDAVDKATFQVLSKFGAFTRQRARSSLKYGDKPGAPGGPPRVHRTMTRMKKPRRGGGAARAQQVSPFREYIFFAYDPARKSVVIGPARLGDKRGDALPALEVGGVAQVKSGDGWRLVGIRPHPTMGPAFEAEKAASLDKLWANSVR